MFRFRNELFSQWYVTICLFLFFSVKWSLMGYFCIWIQFPTWLGFSWNWRFQGTYILETVQDVLIKLDIKPLIHLLEINISSLNNDLVRLTKIMNNLVKDLKILSFKVIFQCLKLVESFQKKIFCEKYLIRRPTYINEIFWKLWFLKYFIY